MSSLGFSTLGFPGLIYKMFESNSIYLTYSCLIAFDSSPLFEGNIRNSWNGFFTSSKAIEKNISKYSANRAFLDLNRYNELKGGLNKTECPFLQGIGSLSLSLRPLTLVNKWEKYIDYLLRENSFESSNNYFGFSKENEDQRFNYVCFELNSPIHIKAETIDGQIANGKIFIQVFPFGLALINYTLSHELKEKKIAPLEIEKIAYNFRPNNRNVNWKSRFGINSGIDLNKKLVETIKKAIFKNSKKESHFLNWHTLIGLNVSKKIVEYQHVIQNTLNTNSYVNIESFERNYTNLKWIIFSRNQSVIIQNRFDNTYRTSNVKQFWNIYYVVLFSHIKKVITDIYINQLKKELIDLQKIRRSLKHSLKNEDILTSGPWNSQIITHIHWLDLTVKKASSKYRFIYSQVSILNGQNDKREKLKIIISEWNEECDKWDHPLLRIWKSILSPIRVLLSG